ncbi:trans-L-3-hydroxyproline dehydratase-like [Ruditapes philippinarum]|uniref:trans-L-3-hydroxyproline dehydratase-like n=1 Tax=Ruditapes philippinarum TaxID=129788 RepID=UPI00295C1A28|nr:trans-L-3-hydroxyproline dehydratase-like [Ruditapes philippinarum]
MEKIQIETIEMHTGGGPLRIVKTGLPSIQGKTILDKIKYLRNNLEYVRKLIIHEPRGHYDMFGVYLVDIEGADIGCIFIHNEGYSTMCGHAIIALGRYVIDHGIVQKPVSAETGIIMQCPCGPVEVFVQNDNGKTGDVRFNSVPSFLFKKDFDVEVPGYGKVTVDISYGGAFFAYMPVKQLGLDLSTTPTDRLRNAASLVTETLKGVLELSHPQSQDLAFLYGTILTDGKDESEESSHMCVFADKEVDRSPCGSGTTGRIAQLFGRGIIKLGQKRAFRGPAGAKFIAKAVKEVKFGCHNAVVVEVSGKGNYTGSSVFTLEADDEIGKGFLLK